MEVGEEMNNTDKWQEYLYNNNIICGPCYKSGKITCDKCKDAVNKHVMSGEAEGWDTTYFCDGCNCVLEDGQKDLAPSALQTVEIGRRVYCIECGKDMPKEPNFDYNDRD
jgi:hypothetical protein